MPYFNYTCSSCGETSEKLRKIDDRHGEVACPYCGGRASFVISAPAGLKGLPNSVGLYSHKSGSTGRWKDEVGPYGNSRAAEKRLDDDNSSLYHPSSSQGKTKAELDRFNAVKKSRT